MHMVIVKRDIILQLIYENELNFTKKCGCWFLNHVCSLAMKFLRGFLAHTPPKGTNIK